MKVMLSYGLAVLLGIVGVTQGAQAGSSNKGNNGDKGKKPTDARIKMTLSPSNPALVDLSSVKGKLDYQSKKGKVHFQVKLRIPSSAPSLGISNAASAAAVPVVLEFARDGTMYNSCTLKLENEEKESKDDGKLNFQLIAQNVSKKKGSRFMKGSCTNGIPEMKKGDSVIGYATVNSQRVNFLKN